MLKHLRFLFIVFILFSCNEKEHKETTYKVENQIRYAQNLEILNKEDGSYIQITQPETKKTIQYFIPAKNGNQKKTDYVTLPVKTEKIIVLSSTHIGMLSKVSGLDKIVGVSNEKYIYNPEIKKGLASGKIHDFGGEELISFEAIVQSGAQVIIYSGFGKDFPHQQKLQKLGIICIPNYDWKEEHPLGKAEWIKFFGLLIGNSNEANKYFDELESNFNELKAEHISAANKPTLLSGNLTGGIWYAPSGDSYMAQLFSNAGANYMYQNTKGIGSVELSLEEVISKNRHTDFWLNPGLSSKAEILESNPKAKYLDAFKNDRIYCYSPKMNFFWEKSAIEPDKVLSDLIKIFHSESEPTDLYFYTKLK